MEYVAPWKLAYAGLTLLLIVMFILLHMFGYFKSRGHNNRPDRIPNALKHSKRKRHRSRR